MQEIGEGAELEDVEQYRRTGILRVLSHTGMQKVLAAAVVIGIIVLGAWYFVFPTNKQQLALTTVNSAAKVTHRDIPNGDKAFLVLSDGQSMQLDQAKSGILTEQAGVTVSKQDGNIISYAAADATTAPAIYNTLKTLNGGQYQVVLPDGSRAWLNAASSIKYPVRFNEGERVVEITGEVYFEVKKQYSVKSHEKIPFSVISPKEKVQVLGTHFNVNAYDEANTSTTLLEGSVKVTHGTASAMLKPGQQSRFRKSGSIDVVRNVDTLEAVAWKNGKFDFKECPLKTIMADLARWYDLEVVYNPSYNNKRPFTTNALRNEPLSKVLNKLEATGDVHFKQDGRKIIVMM
jgi:ferric-dicitrate binding protein FerR (iron transport regulator)